MGQRLLLDQGCFPTLSQIAAKGWGNGSWLWGRGFERGLAADLVSWKMGGREFVGLKPHASSVLVQARGEPERREQGPSGP
jgi:hypothetical protein